MENLSGKSNNSRKVFRASISPVEGNKKIGPLRTNIYNFAYAASEKEKGNDSVLVLKVDDTDSKIHTKSKFLEIQDLLVNDLGLKFDIDPQSAQQKIGTSLYQSERSKTYDTYLKNLYDSGTVTVDPESGLPLFDIESFIGKFQEEISILDEVQGPIYFNLENLLREGKKYVPLLRSNGDYLYHLASVADDAELGVTNIVRGQDKIPAAQFQEMLRVALRLEPVKYAHTPLLLDSSGKLLSGDVLFSSFVKSGILPQSLVSYLISSGYGNPDRVYPSLQSFVAEFDVKQLHKSNGFFDPKRLMDINQKMLSQLRDSEYSQNVVAYVTELGGVELKVLLEDENILQLLVKLRKNPADTLSLLVRLKSPTYSTIPHELLSPARTIAGILTQGVEFDSIASISNLPPKVWNSCVRWITLGELDGPPVRPIFEYLTKISKIEERAHMALAQLGGDK